MYLGGAFSGTDGASIWILCSAEECLLVVNDVPSNILVISPLDTHGALSFTELSRRGVVGRRVLRITKIVCHQRP